MADEVNEDVLLSGGEYGFEDNLLDYDEDNEDNILSENFQGPQQASQSGGDLRASLGQRASIAEPQDDDDDESHDDAFNNDLLDQVDEVEDDLLDRSENAVGNRRGSIGGNNGDSSPNRERVGRFDTEREDVRAQLTYKEDTRNNNNFRGRGGHFRGGHHQHDGKFAPRGGNFRGSYAPRGRGYQHQQQPNFFPQQQQQHQQQQQQHQTGLPIIHQVGPMGMQMPQADPQQLLLANMRMMQPQLMQIEHAQLRPQMFVNMPRPVAIIQQQQQQQPVSIVRPMDPTQQQAELFQALMMEREKQFALDRQQQEQQQSLIMQRQHAEIAQQQAHALLATQAMLLQQKAAALNVEEEKLRKQQDAFLAQLAAKPVRNAAIQPSPQKQHPLPAQTHQPAQPQVLSGEPKRKILLNPQFQQKMMAQQQQQPQPVVEEEPTQIAPPASAAGRRIVLAPMKRDSTSLGAPSSETAKEEHSPVKQAKPSEPEKVEKSSNGANKEEKPPVTASNSYESEYERAEREREIARTKVRIRREASRYQMSADLIVEVEKMVFEQNVDVSAAVAAVKQGLRAPTKKPTQNVSSVVSKPAPVNSASSARRSCSVLIENVSSATSSDKIVKWCNNVGEVVSFTRKSSNSVVVKFQTARAAADMAAKYSRWSAYDEMRCS